MPAAFEKCQEHGGKIRTKKINKSEYIRICYKNGSSYPGEVKKKKKIK